MTQHLAYLLLGLGAGAALSLLACGIVLTDRASGVINFGHASMGMYLAHVFYEFRETGDLVLPVIGLPARFHLLDRPTVAAAVLIIAAYSALIGAITYLLIFRRLRRAPALARVVASIGLFLYLWAMVGLRFPQPPLIRRLLPSDAVEIFGRKIFQDRLWAAAIAVAVTAVLWAVYRFTRFGLSTIAASESEKGAGLTGLDANRLALVNWMLATMLGAAAMVIIAPVTQLDPLNLSLLVVPALAAMLLGGGKSFVRVSAAAFSIGMAQSEIVNLQVSWPSTSGLGLAQALPFALILATLAVTRRTPPGRGDIVGSHLPDSPEPKHVAATAIGLATVACFVLATAGPSWRAAIITSAIATVISLSVVVLTGYVGQISLVPFAFAGVAAFGVALFSAWDFPFPLAPLLAILISGVLGIAIGLPATKVRGMNLAIATLGAAVAIEQLVFKWRWFVSAGTNGATQPKIGPINLGISATGLDYPRAAFGYFAVGVAVICAISVANLRRGRTGLQWLAVRSNERAAAAAGVDVTRAKLTAFALSAVLAGIGGVLLTYQRQSVSTDSFAVFLSLSALAMAYLAGIASISGAVIAGVLTPLGVFTVLSGQGGATVSPYAYVINGAALVFAAVLYPTGISGALSSIGKRLPKLAGRQRELARSEPVDAA